MYRVIALILAIAVLATGCSQPAATPVPTPAGVTNKVLSDRPETHHGIFTAGGNGITTIVQKNVAQSNLLFPTMALTITGTQAPYVEATIASGGTLTLTDGLGNGTQANLQMLNVWTDSLDVTISAGTVAGAFGTTAGTISVPQGTPYEWDNGGVSGGTAGIPFNQNWKSFSVSVGTIGTSSGGTAANTNVHVRSSFSQ